jgi:hypothetical protein
MTTPRAPVNATVHELLTGEGVFTHRTADGGFHDYNCDIYRDGFGFEYMVTECAPDELWDYRDNERKPSSDMVWSVFFRDEDGNNYVISANRCTSPRRGDAATFNESHARQIAACIDANNKLNGHISSKCRVYKSENQ